MTTPEQQAREMLERMGIQSAYQRMSAGELVELANLIAERDALKAELERVKAERDDWGKRWHQERRKVAELQYPGMTGVVKPQSKELAAIKGAGEPVAWGLTATETKRTDMDKPTPPILSNVSLGTIQAIAAYGEAMAAWGAAQEREKIAKEIDKLECELGESDSAFQNTCIENTRLKAQLRIVSAFVGDPAKPAPNETLNAMDAALNRIFYPRSKEIDRDNKT